MLINKSSIPSQFESSFARRCWQIGVVVVCAYFCIKIIYFAFRIKENIFPDEATWFGISDLFSRFILLPGNSPESYPFGLVTHIPSLYFFIMGKALLLNHSSVSDLIFLRGLNVVFGVLTLYFAFRLICLLSNSLAVRLLFLVMLTNTTMYTFIFGAVNYDNVSNLLAVLSLFYIVRFFQLRRVHDCLLFFIFMLAGMLTKNVFLPYAFSLVLVFVFFERKKLVNLSRVKKRLLHPPRTGNMVLFSVVLLLLFLNLNLYAVNKVKFGVLIPGMDKVLSVENCLKNRLFARNYGAQEVKAGRMTVLEAQRIALQVRDPGDRAFAWAMIEKASLEKDGKEIVRMGRLAYSLEWCKYMFSRTYGIAAHIVMQKSNKELYPYYGVFVLAGLVTLIKSILGLASWRASLLFITGFYTVILMQAVNYQNYQYSGFVGLALTGRYLFPILVPLYILVADALMAKMPKWWQWGVGVSVSGIFLLGEFPWFLQNVTSDWYF